LSAENRLTAEQLAALAPGDVVTVESGQEFGRRRHVTATVVRVDGSSVFVRCNGPRGASYVERYGLRDGFRVGGGTRAELVNPPPGEPAARDLLLRETRQIDLLYRAWNRRREDVQALRQLHIAIGAYLDDALVD
jgi:hypothetical protein